MTETRSKLHARREPENGQVAYLVKYGVLVGEEIFWPGFRISRGIVYTDEPLSTKLAPRQEQYYEAV
jgi:hypothetical protein